MTRIRVGCYEDIGIDAHLIKLASIHGLGSKSIQSLSSLVLPSVDGSVGAGVGTGVLGAGGGAEGREMGYTSGNHVSTI